MAPEDISTRSSQALRQCAAEFATAAARLLSAEQAKWHKLHGASLIGMPILNFDVGVYGDIADVFGRLGIMRPERASSSSAFICDLNDISDLVRGRGDHAEGLMHEAITCSYALLTDHSADVFYNRQSFIPCGPSWRFHPLFFGHGDWFEPAGHYVALMASATACGLAEGSGARFRWTPLFSRLYVEAFEMD